MAGLLYRPKLFLFPHSHFHRPPRPPPVLAIFSTSPTAACLILGMLSSINYIEAPAPGCVEREYYGTSHTGYYPAIMELPRRIRRTKHYRTAEMAPPPWDPTRVALSASSNLWVITGPSGSGKSRVGKHLYVALGFIFIEGDDVSYSPHLPIPSLPTAS